MSDSPQHSSMFERAIEQIDALHADDPVRVLIDGVLCSAELVYARRMTHWLQQLESEPTPTLQLAVRAQHLCRWRIPRSDYPMDRNGYKRWRTTLAAMHANLCADVLRSVGYPDDFIETTTSLILKRGLKVSRDAQTLEDVACLVFLQYGLQAFAEKHPAEKTVSILQKTWRKMSDRGHSAALGIEYPDSVASLVTRAVAGGA